MDEYIGLQDVLKYYERCMIKQSIKISEKIFNMYTVVNKITSGIKIAQLQGLLRLLKIIAASDTSGLSFLAIARLCGQ